MSRTGFTDTGPSTPASPAEPSIPWSTALALARSAGARPATALDTFEGHLTRHLEAPERSRRGVHYTPAPLARFVVRYLHGLLEHLGLEGGITAPRVRLVDPAAGTGRFLAEALRLSVDVDPRVDRAALLARATALDVDAGALLGAAYELARITGGTFPQFLHGDALHPDTWGPGGWPRGVVPEPGDVPVFLGNPPWAGYELGIHPWVEGLLKPYRAALPRKLRRNAKWLRDPYVQYLAVLHHAMCHHERGALGLVVNHSVLDNQVMAGLRQAFLEDFTGLWLLDLGGSAHKPKPMGENPGADDNVFPGVAQGVAVLLAVRGGTPQDEPHHYRLTGTREEKLTWLAHGALATTPWQRLGPAEAPHLWIPTTPWPEDWTPLPELFREHSIGIITGRDRLVIAPSREELLERISLLQRCGSTAEAQAQGLALQATKTFDADTALHALRDDPEWESRLHPILYKPGREKHWIFYADYLLERPRWGVMRHLLDPRNRALVVPRRAENTPEVTIAPGGTLVGHKAASRFHGSHVFPLWQVGDGGELRSNVRAEVLEGWGVGDVEAFEHVARVLRDPGYCRRYNGSLRVGWPRVSPPRRTDA